MKTLIFLVCLIPSLCFGQMVSGNARAGGNAAFGSAAAASPGGQFTYYATKASGSSGNYLTNSTALGASDGDEGTVSFWYRGLPDYSQTYYVLANSDGTVVVKLDSQQVRITIKDSGNNNVATLYGTAGGLNCASSQEWYHIAAGWHGSATTGWIMTNGVADTGGTILVDNRTADWTGPGYLVIGDLPWYGSLCELWVDNRYYASTCVDAYFRDSGTGKPKDLGATGNAPGAQPLIYLHSGMPNFGDNAGSGGNFSRVGTLENDTSIP